MNQNKHRESDSENYKKRLRRYLLRFAAPQHAVINNIRTFNPCKGVKPTKTQKQEKQVYSCDEVKTILAALNDAMLSNNTR